MNDERPTKPANQQSVAHNADHIDRPVFYQPSYMQFKVDKPDDDDDLELLKRVNHRKDQFLQKRQTFLN